MIKDNKTSDNNLSINSPDLFGDHTMLDLSGEHDKSDLTGVHANAASALSVSAALTIAKTHLENINVVILGEVSQISNKEGYKAVYFTVKDEQSSLPCMMWKNRFNKSGIKLELGQLVQLVGRFSLYAPKGRMSFDVLEISLAGEGNLRMKVAALARKLDAEGLTSAARKQSLPHMPLRIGVVTSPRGAAVHDVLRTMRRRYPIAHILFAGIPVEGVNAASGMIQALKTVVSAGAEMVLLVRGGGSFEDLMPFNDESLARSIAACPVPVVTGIGHEPDNTIADMVSDVRASTPTAAAEAACPDIATLNKHYKDKVFRLCSVVQSRIERSRLAISNYAEHSVLKDPNSILLSWGLHIDALSSSLARVMPQVFLDIQSNLSRFALRLKTTYPHLLEGKHKQLALQASRLNDLSPLAILSRGYSITHDSDGRIVKSIEGVSEGDKVVIKVSDGSFDACVEKLL